MAKIFHIAKPLQFFVPLTAFGIAMGFLEAIVAIYLRQMYYPAGFSFPLTPLPSNVLALEILREAATIVMLATVGILAGQNHIARLASFLYAFAVWDIVYYVGLKLFLNWPPSVFTWDVLFLIPVVWVGPVLAPVICSCTMILLAIGILFKEIKGHPIRIIPREWLLCFTGAFAIFISFIWDYSKIILEGGFLSRYWRLADNEHFLRIISHYRPDTYHWGLFLLGEGLILLSFMLALYRTRKG